MKATEAKTKWQQRSQEASEAKGSLHPEGFSWNMEPLSSHPGGSQGAVRQKWRSGYAQDVGPLYKGGDQMVYTFSYTVN